MRAKALSILVANSEKALNELDRKRKAHQQAEKLENFVKDVAIDLDNMLTRFYFQKERRQMTDAQTKTLEDFVNFTKTLTKKVRSLLTPFQKSQTFEERLDRETKEIEIQVKQRLKEFDEVLSETSDTLKGRLIRYASNIVSGLARSFKGKSFGVVSSSSEKQKHQLHIKT